MSLNTERNTIGMGRRIRNAAFELGLGHIGDLNPFFEHGQWWVQNRRTGAQWSACDAEGTQSQGVFDGFCFEIVTDSNGEDGA